MKQFVYFDKDFIDSYLSQINKGLITSLQKEFSDLLEQAKSETKEPEHSNRKASISIPQILALEYGTVDGYTHQSQSSRQNRVTTELVSKVIHDDSFDSFISELEAEDLLKDLSKTDIAYKEEYIHINDKIDIIDLSHIVNVFDENFYEVYNKTQYGQLEEHFKSLNREQKRDKDVKEKEKQFKEEAERDVEGIKYSIKMIELMRNMLPSDIFIIYNNLLIPLNRKYLREDPKSIRFKYTEKIHLVGKVTGSVKDILGKEVGNDLENVIRSLDKVTLSMLEILFPGSDLKILYPISLYFE